MSFPVFNGGDGVPPEPDWQSVYSDALDVAAAHEEWTAVVREMTEANSLTVANGHAIKRLVEFRVQYERLAKTVADSGAITKVKRQATYSPYWIAMRQADESIRTLEAELCISPLRRAKAGKVQRAKKTARAADNYLRPVAK